MAERKARSASKPKSKSKSDLIAENAKLRDAVDAQTSAALIHQSRLATVHPHHRTPQSELMVGLRNISDLTVGLKGHLPGDPEIQLFPSHSKDAVGTGTVVSYGHWRELRKGREVAAGMIMRDDSLLGASYMAAPDDDPKDMPASWAINAVLDPEEWIESRTEAQIRTDVEAMTSEDSVRRLRRVVDDALRTLQASYANPTSAESAAKAVRNLPARLHMVDTVTTSKLEHTGEEDEDDGLGRKTDVIELRGRRLR